MMDKDKGWLEEILRDVNEDVKSWPKWLKDKEPENQSHNNQCTEPDVKEHTKAKKANAA
jgi:hypothetical protein